jgi:hypothetical protein
MARSAHNRRLENEPIEVIMARAAGRTSIGSGPNRTAFKPSGTSGPPPLHSLTTNCAHQEVTSDVEGGDPSITALAEVLRDCLYVMKRWMASLALS